MSAFTESVVEEAALEWFEALGYTITGGPSIAPGEPGQERRSYADVVLDGRLREALARLNPTVSREGLDEAFRKLTRISSPQPVDANHELHYYLVNGVSVEYQRADGTIGYDPVRVVDFDVLENNDWLVVNQLTVSEGGHNRGPDVVVFLNGLPIAVIELKNAASENATIWNAFQQLQTYKQELPSLFVFNELLVVSDGLEARIGTLSSNKERFLPWRTIEGESLASKTMSQLEVLIRGVFDKRRLLDLLRYFIVFEDDGDTAIKKVAGYHQFHAVARALDATISASRPQGDRRVGVVWHTQGSGKSLTMAFYAGRVVLHPTIQNPTLIVLTDRNDLDEQLFGTFARCKDLLRQSPEQAKDRAHLRELLKVASGGVVFTTIQQAAPRGHKEGHGSERKEAMTRPAHTDDASALMDFEASARAEVVLPADAHVLLDLASDTEEPEYEEQSQGSLASLSPLRIELMRGDLRPAYLAWLLAVSADDLEGDAEEPSVPAGLGELPAAQEAMVEFLRIDVDLVSAAASASAAVAKDDAPFRRWLAALPIKEKDAWLTRAADDPALGLGGELLRAFRATTNAEHHGARRTVRELRALAEAKRAEREKAETERARRTKAEAEAARHRHLTKLGRDVEGAWAKLEKLVEASDYDVAVKLAIDLRDLATQEATAPNFAGRFEALRKRQLRRRGFFDRWKRANENDSKDG
jgi:hypothetical protein